ncbi:MAG: UDP-N-acetylmuramoyl-tripeptide--D-alanyl-D-alanine ligase [Eubacteriales bacterium]|nr:UDP-N-acetylmuramoyl-tripeptide--D-alanyl-D-alanine ligase [Eubacteriales bacterium]
MIKLSLKDYAFLLGYEYQGDEEIYFNRIILDSRKVISGDLFLAVKGEETDGHKYISQALENGAVGVLSLGENQDVLLEKANYIIGNAKDTIEEVFYKTGKIIKSKSKAKIIGITGSVGKTSTKDMLYAVLKKEFQVIKTEGNYNNELGLPMTMTKADENTDFMILEMGMRGLGEISYLSEIAEPDYGIITSIEPVHAELLGSIENIAKAKSEIAEKISQQGCLVINYKDKNLLMPNLNKFKGKIITVGFSKEADYFIKEITNEEEKGTEFILESKDNERKIRINVLGNHNVQNAAAVTALADYIGVNEKSLEGLQEVDFSEMRFSIKEVADVKIINDAYNANPSSTSFALESLSKIKGNRKIFIFADMFELGDYEKEGHERIGLKAKEEKVDIIFLLGDKVSYTYDKLRKINYNMKNVFFFNERTQLLEQIKKIIQKGDVILLKGSRGMHLEKTEKEIEEFLNVL